MLTPWKESYDQPRQHIKKQRHYFANKCPSNQRYSFSSSHVWMLELDYKKSWALKNWCFWTVVLELTHWKRLWCWERLKVGGERDDRGWDGLMTSPTQHMSLSKLWELVMDMWWWTGRPGILQSMGSQTVRHNWVTELNWSVKKNTLKRIHMKEFNVCSICKTNIYKDACQLMDASIWSEGAGNECSYKEVTEEFCDCVTIQDCDGHNARLDISQIHRTHTHTQRSAYING